MAAASGPAPGRVIPDIHNMLWPFAGPATNI